MALLKGNKNQIPPNAVMLTEEEAIQHQLNIVDRWTPKHEMWPIKSGSLILAGVNAVTGLLICENFRSKCFLPGYTRFMVGLPIVTVSSIGIFLLQTKFITEDLLLGKTPCIVCLQSRSITIQGLLGPVYSTFCMSFGSLLLAQRINTIHIPMLNKEPMKFLKFGQKLVEKSLPLFTTICLVQFGIVLTITYLQMESVFKLSQRVSKV